MKTAAASEPTIMQTTSAVRDFVTRFRRHRLAVCGSVVLILIGLTVYVGPLLLNASYETQDLTRRFKPPDRVSWFGTNELGQDTFIRILYGGRISLVVGLVSALSATVIGVALGAVSGYAGGWLDGLVMRTVDVMISLPVLPLMLFAALLFRGGILSIVTVLVIFGWAPVARLMRGQILALKQQDFVQAARAIGVRSRRIIRRHLIPNAMGPVLVSMTLRVSGAILYESTLSYLGLGIQPPTPSWGNMLRRSMHYVTGFPGYAGVPWWLILFPGLMILITVLSVNFVGDGLRDALDPRSEARR